MGIYFCLIGLEYKFSFYPRTIQEWNRLPPATDMGTVEGFEAATRPAATH